MNTENSDEKVFENEFIKLALKNGICYGFYKEGYQLTLEIAKRVVEDRIRFFGGKSYPTYADITRLKEVSTDARKYLAGDRANHLVKAGAVHVTSSFGCWLANVYLLLDSPKIPVRLFTSIDPAIAWLSKFRQ